MRVVAAGNAGDDGDETKREKRDDDPIGTKGEHVAIVGIGARGLALIDQLADARALPNAEYWALNADVNALQRCKAGNRWRLPPQNVEVSAKAVHDNAVSAAMAVLEHRGSASGERARTILVACAGGEASESGTAFMRAVANEKNAKAKKGFFGFKGSSRAPEGGVMIAGVVEPFTFEGKRKSAACEDFLRAASSPGTCDVVLTVSQSELLKNGEDDMSVQDATSIADASMLFALLSSTDTLKSSCWNTSFAGDVDDPESWVSQLDKSALRAMVNKTMASRSGGCGVSHVGRGVAEVPTYGSADEACAAAVRGAIAQAAQQSPFLAPGRFDTAALVVCTIKHGNTLGPLARQAASQAIGSLTAAEQFISIPPPDKRGMTEVEVTLLCVTDADVAIAAAPESRTVQFVQEEPKQKVNPMLFVPGYEDDSAPKRKTQKLSRDDLKKFGYGDMKTMVVEQEVAREAATGVTPAVTQTLENTEAMTTIEAEQPVVFSFDETQRGASPVESSIATAPAVEKERVSSDTVKIPLPRDFASKQVAVRISEPQQDDSGNVIGYKTLNGSDAKKESPMKRAGSLFGWRPNKSKKEEKSNLSKRAMGMLEKDRIGADRAVVRMEFANMSVYEGEWANGKREGEGRQVFADGDWYEGKWYGDVPDGKGRLTWKSGELSYFEGMFNQGKPDGRGTLTWTSGKTVSGSWREGALVSVDES